jgi:hypothetical protein
MVVVDMPQQIRVLEAVERVAYSVAEEVVQEL